MAITLSTACVNMLAQDKTLKEIFHDGVIKIYSGTRPTEADQAVVGVELFSITLNGDQFVPGQRSTKQVEKVTVTSVPSDGTNISLTLNSGLPTQEDYSYTINSGDTEETIVNSLYEAIDEASSLVDIVKDGSSFYLQAKFGGVPFTLTVSDSSILSTTNIQASNRVAGIQWGDVNNGVLSKEPGDWRGTAVADGIASWFRMYANAPDSGAADTNAQFPRLDGSVGTTSGDMILRTTNIQTNDVIIISQASITIPKY